MREQSGWVDIYAHRGSTVLSPENTAPAFQQALSAGADVLEIDVRLARDGHLVVFHDETVDRNTDGSGKVSQLTLTELKTLDAAYHFTDSEGKSYRGQGVGMLSLDELFELFPSTRINIDIKDKTDVAALAVSDCIERRGRHASVNVGSFHASVVREFRQLSPEVSTAATKQEAAALYFGLPQMKPPAYQYLQIPTRYMGLSLDIPRVVKRAAALNVQTVYWTVNDREHMQKLINLGVSGIVTDRTDLAAALLQR